MDRNLFFVHLNFKDALKGENGKNLYGSSMVVEFAKGKDRRGDRRDGRNGFGGRGYGGRSAPR